MDDKILTTNAQVTAEAQRIVGHQNVRATIANNMTSEFIAMTPVPVGPREIVPQSEVPREEIKATKDMALKNFLESGTNGMVKTGRVYKK